MTLLLKKMSMSDWQRYPANLYLMNNLKNNIVFSSVKTLFTYVNFSIVYEAKNALVTFVEKPKIKIRLQSLLQTLSFNTFLVFHKHSMKKYFFVIRWFNNLVLVPTSCLWLSVTIWSIKHNFFFCLVTCFEWWSIKVNFVNVKIVEFIDQNPNLN